MAACRMWMKMKRKKTRMTMKMMMNVLARDSNWIHQVHAMTMMTSGLAHGLNSILQDRVMMMKKMSSTMRKKTRLVYD
jgi:hypothetical protein